MHTHVEQKAYHALDIGTKRQTVIYSNSHSLLIK
jgi:hypothetical protein